MTEAATFDDSKNNLPVNKTEHKQGQGKHPQNRRKQLQEQESSTTMTNKNEHNSHKSIHDNGGNQDNQTQLQDTTAATTMMQPWEMMTQWQETSTN